MRWCRIGSLGLFAAFVLSGCGAAFEGNAGDAGQDGAKDGTVPVVDAGDDGISLVDGSGDATVDVIVDSGSGDATVGDGGGGADADAGSTTDSGGGEGGVIESGTGDGSTVDSGSGDGGSDGGPIDSGTIDTGIIDSGGVDAGPLCPTGEVCVAGAPTGWSGPIEFYYASSADPSCPALTSVAFTGGTGLVAPPATCSSCTCGGAVSCTDPVLDFYSDTCTTQCNTATASTTCGTMLNGCGTADPAYVTAKSLPTAAGCAPSGQTPTKTQSWTTNAEGCAPLGVAVACGTGQVCSPVASSSFTTCVYQAGDVACPGGTYVNKQLIDTGVADTRTCTSCTCGAASGAACSGGAVIVGTTGTCSAGTLVAVPTACRSMGSFQLPASMTILENTAPKPNDATCASGGGQPTGTATATTPITVCCGP